MQRNIRSIPLFIEQFVNSEAEFAEKKDAWRCDGDRQRFSDWSAWRDVLERVAMPKQGAYTPLHLDDFICTGISIYVDSSNFIVASRDLRRRSLHLALHLR